MIHRAHSGIDIIYSQLNGFEFPNDSEFTGRKLEGILPLNLPYNIRLEGVLTVDDGDDETRVERLRQALTKTRKKLAIPQSVSFVVYDMFDSNKPELAYLDRLDALHNLIYPLQLPALRLPMVGKVVQLNLFQPLYEIHNKGTGVYLREPEAVYQVGLNPAVARVNNLKFETVPVLDVAFKYNGLLEIEVKFQHGNRELSAPMRLSNHLEAFNFVEHADACKQAVIAYEEDVINALVLSLS